MPIQVQHRPSELPSRVVDKYPEQDPRQAASKNMQSRSEALRLALGTILSPKRPPLPHTPRSSGTASPAYGFPFPASGPQTPGSDAPAQDYTHHTPHGHSHLNPTAAGHTHPLSRLHRSHSGNPQTTSSSASSSAQPSPHNSPKPEMAVADKTLEAALVPLPEDAMSQTRARPLLEKADSLPVAPYAQNQNAEVPEAASARSSESAPPSSSSSASSSGTGTPRARFLETLQGKSAWDALIHGQFSS